MTARLHRTRRLLAVQRQLDHLSEWRLLELLSQSAFLDERHRSLVHFLQQESAFGGMFSMSMLRRLQWLAEMRAKPDIEQEAQRTRHLQDLARLRRAERIVRELENDETRKDAVHELEATIDSTAQWPSQGPRKLLPPPCQTSNLQWDIDRVDKPGFGYCSRCRDGSVVHFASAIYTTKLDAAWTAPVPHLWTNNNFLHPEHKIAAHRYSRR